MTTRILFLCTGNSCRSQMAEGFARALDPKNIEAFSAGVEKHGMNPYAIQVMEECGVDMSYHYSKTLSDLNDIIFDLVITVCGNAHENCPIFHGNVKVVHHGFDDPPKLASNCKSDEDKLKHYRRVRDEIQGFIQSLPELLKKTGGST